VSVRFDVELIFIIFDISFMKKAVILISGGADSATVLAIALEQGYQVYAISFDYNQRHQIELHKAQKITKGKVVSHKIIKVDTSVFQSSALANLSLDVPKFSDFNELPTDIPITYVPGRNTLFLSYALSYAESIDAFDIFIGVHRDDFANYPDCRPEFIAQFEALANVATATPEKISIHAPLLDLNKSQIIHEGLKRGVDYSSTISCYDPDENDLSCGACLACHVRLEAFANNDTPDPIKYKN
jgi:7-cyano-7-deazaguanine synthase